MIRVLSTLLLSTLFASALSAQGPSPLPPNADPADYTCTIYDANGDEIWSGPCDTKYGDDCFEYQPACPTLDKCRAGEVDDLEEGEGCYEGKIVVTNDEGEEVGSDALCYCKVPDDPSRSPLPWALGILAGLAAFGRRFRLA
jgi:MYXO-CTERM domain-containing protein